MENIENILSPVTEKKLAKNRKYFLIGATDYFSGLKKWTLLSYAAYADIRRRYRRTILGPFWATLSLAIFIGSMGILFSLLWHTHISTYLPFFASGYIVWIFFSTLLIESCGTFTAHEGYLKQVAMPYSFYAYLIILRNFIIFLHQFIIYFLIALIFHVPLTLYTWLVIPAFLLLILNISWIAIALGLLCSRFRDVQQLVNSILQILMFVTPLFWPESQLGHHMISFICIELNPVYHFVSVVRYPLLGHAPSPVSWIADIAILILGWTYTMRALGRYYPYLIYWL